MLESGRSIERVFTQPPSRAGRGRKLSPSPVQIVSESADIETITPDRKELNPELLQDMDLLLVAAYGVLLPSDFLNTPKRDCVNVHASLLPRWRGASPIEHAILAGDSVTGVSIMRIVPQLDAGPVYKKACVAIRDTATTACLTSALAELGAKSLIDVVAGFEREEQLQPVPQNGADATYAPRLVADDARISWLRSAEAISRQVRAFHGRLSAFATLGDIRLKILSATPVTGSLKPARVTMRGHEIIVGCGHGGLSLNQVQINRGKGVPMTAQAVANGFPQILGDGVDLDLP